MRAKDFLSPFKKVKNLEEKYERKIFKYEEVYQHAADTLAKENAANRTGRSLHIGVSDSEKIKCFGLSPRPTKSSSNFQSLWDSKLERKRKVMKTERKIVEYLNSFLTFVCLTFLGFDLSFFRFFMIEF